MNTTFGVVVDMDGIGACRVGVGGIDLERGSGCCGDEGAGGGLLDGRCAWQQIALKFGVQFFEFACQCVQTIANSKTRTIGLQLTVYTLQPR